MKVEQQNACLSVTRRPRAFYAVATQPAKEEWAYQIARAFQLSATNIGLLLNIRRCHVNTVDTEVGNDLVILDRLDSVTPKVMVPLNRSEVGTHPRTGEQLLMCRYPLAGGFVPLGACLADGTPHPHAGTGFGMSHIIGFPVDAVGKIVVHGEWQIKDKYSAVELQQYRYDGTTFIVEHTERILFDKLLAGWQFTSMPLGNCLADGSDLLGGLVGKPVGSDRPTGSGLARWQRRDGRWGLTSFVPVTGADKSYEPSLVRDGDGSLLFAVRGGQPGPNENAVMVWRSTDNGTVWEKVIHVPKVRAGTPVTINQGLDGTPYIAANPDRATDTLGRRSPSIEMRETLLLWPLSKDRRHLLEPLLARDCNADFGKPPHGSIWRADHPVGLNVRLADGQWHHLLTYRGLEQNECTRGAPATQYTGTYVEEVLTPGPALPAWRFKPFSDKPEFLVKKMTTDAGTVFAMLPPHDGAPAPTLLLFAMAGPATLTTMPYSRVGQLLHAQGWNVVSIDLPCHGADRRTGEPEELAGWAARTAKGEDIVVTFQRQVNDVVAYLIAKNVADPDRIAAAGTSRGGFMVFQAAAGNPRLRAVAAFSPVTDLIALSEFSGLKSNALAMQLSLVNAAGKLADRAAWITIGDQDGRVGTERSIAFAKALTQAAGEKKVKARVDLHVVPVPGHTSLQAWHDQAATWFQQTVGAAR
jgi:acetyl esterase/lipase